MAKKTKTVGKLSSGKKTAMNIAKEANRQARFARRREAGASYEYKPNPFNKKSDEFVIESEKRAAKNPGKRLFTARMTSVFNKLDNELANSRAAHKEAKERAVKKTKTA